MSGFAEVLFIVTALASSVVALAFLMRIFSEREATQDGDNPASHFKLKELIARRTITWLSFLCSLPFAAMFLVLSLKSSTLLDAVKVLLSHQLTGILDPKFSGDIERVLGAVPPWLSPLFVVIVSLVMFAPHVRAPFVLFRNLVFNVLDIDVRVNEEAERAATAVLARMSRRDAERALVQAAGARAAPLPRGMAGTPELKRMAFQILYFSKATIQKSGTNEGLAATLKRIGVELPAVETRSPVQYGHVFAAMTFYGMLCAAYVIFAPIVAPWLQSSDFVKAVLQQVEWPAFRDELSLSIVQRTLSFIFPLATGMYMFTARRRQQPDESIFQAYVFILSIQFLLSLFVNLGFAVMFVAQRATGEQGGFLLSFSDFRLWTDAFVYALTPGAALLSWIHCGRMRVGGAATIGRVCLAAAIAFGTCQFLYELMSEFHGYFWHQLVLGAFITMSYGLAALVARDVFPPFGTASAMQPMQPQPATVATTGGTG